MHKQVQSYKDQNTGAHNSQVDTVIFSILTGGNNLLTLGLPQFIAIGSAAVAALWLAKVELEMIRHPINTINTINTVSASLSTALSLAKPFLFATAASIVAIGSVLYQKNLDIAHAIKTIKAHTPKQDMKFVAYSLPDLSNSPFGQNTGHKILNHIAIPYYQRHAAPIINHYAGSYSGIVDHVALYIGNLLAYNLDHIARAVTFSVVQTDKLLVSAQLQGITIISMTEIQDMAIATSNFHNDFMNYQHAEAMFIDHLHPSSMMHQTIATSIAKIIKKDVIFDWSQSEVFALFKDVALHIKAINLNFKYDICSKCKSDEHSYKRLEFIEQIEQSIVNAVDGKSANILELKTPNLDRLIAIHAAQSGMSTKVSSLKTIISKMHEDYTICDHYAGYFQLSGEIISLAESLPAG